MPTNGIVKALSWYITIPGAIVDVAVYKFAPQPVAIQGVISDDV